MDPNTLTVDQLSYWICRLKPLYPTAAEIAGYLAPLNVTAANLIEPLRRNGFAAGDIAAAIAAAYQMQPVAVGTLLTNAGYDTNTVADCLRFNLKLSWLDTVTFLGDGYFGVLPDPGKTYFIAATAGLSSANRLLSVNPDNSLSLVDHDDGSGRQLWRFTTAGPAMDNIFTISPLIGTWPNAFLSCNIIAPFQNITTAISSSDDGSGRQRWMLGTIGDGSFNILSTADHTTPCNALSCSPDGSVINLANGNNQWPPPAAVGLQQWRLLPWPATDGTEYVIEATGLSAGAGTFLSCAAGYPPTDPFAGAQEVALRASANWEGQHWTFEWIGSGSGYRIRPVLGLACLSCHQQPPGSLPPPQTLTTVDLYASDDGSGRQHWNLTPTGDGRFTITVVPVISTPPNPNGPTLNYPDYNYLSCPPDGSVVNLWNAVQGPGCQQWTVKAAAPVGPPFQLPAYVTSAGYDLVCAVTQQNLENTLAAYALDLKTPEFSAYYGPGGASLSQATVEGWLGGTDPLTLAAGTIPPNLLTPAFSSGFSWAFKATPFTADKLPKHGQFHVIALDQGPSSVRHQVSFKEFTLIWLTPPATLNVFNQDPNQPVVFSSRHDLQAGAGDFSSLPADLQARLKAQNQGASFSVTQLFLDLANSTVIDVVPPLDGVPNALNDAAAIVSQYWQQVPANAGVLGYSVGVQGSPVPSITPTALGFVVSPHLGPDGKPDGNLDLNTLNYLVMSQNRALPATSPFAWNWVEDDSIGGVMSVRGGIFAGFLTQLLNALPATANLCIQPGIQDDGTGTFPVSTSPASWTADGNGVQSIQFFPADNQGTANIPGGNSGTSSWDIHYAMTGSITPGSNTLTLSLNVLVHVHLHNTIRVWVPGSGPHGGYWKTQDMDCKIVDYTQSVPYSLTVAPGGQLIATPPTPLPPAVDNSETPEADWPFSGFTAGLQTSVQTAVTNAINGCTNAIQAALGNNSPSDWVFPVAGTFSPSGVTVPFNGDVTIDISYTNNPD